MKKREGNQKRERNGTSLSLQIVLESKQHVGNVTVCPVVVDVQHLQEVDTVTVVKVRQK